MLPLVLRSENMKSAPSRKEFRKHMLCFIRRTHLGSVVATFRWSSVGGGQVVSQIASQELPCTRLHSPPPLHHYHLPIHLLLLHQLLLLNLLLLFLLLLPLLVLMLSLPPRLVIHIMANRLYAIS